MKKEILFVFVFITLVSANINAQISEKNKKLKSHFNLGLGYGIDYGVLGFRLSYLPVKYVGVFFGGGYDFVGVEKNTGLLLRILPDKTICPYLTVVSGSYSLNHSSNLQKIKFGYSAGLGVEIWMPGRRNFFSIEFFTPPHSRAWNTLTDDSDYNLKSIPPNIFSMGFHFLPR